MIDKIVDGVGGNLIEKSVRKIGFIISILLTIIAAVFSVTAIIITLVAGENVLIPLIISAVIIVVIWVIVTVAARLIAAKISRVVGGRLVSGAVENVVSEIGRTILAALTIVAGIFSVATIIVTLIAGGNVLIPLIISAVIIVVIWVIISVVFRLIASIITRAILEFVKGQDNK